MPLFFFDVKNSNNSYSKKRIKCSGHKDLYDLPLFFIYIKYSGYKEQYDLPLFFY